MGNLTAAQLVAITDKMARAYTALKGDGTITNGISYGSGDARLPLGTGSVGTVDWGWSKELRELENIILGFGDYNVSSALSGAFHEPTKEAAIVQQVARKFSRPLLALDSLCNTAGIAGVRNVNTFSAYYNVGVGGTYTSLHSPQFNTLYTICKGAGLSPTNVFTVMSSYLAQKTQAGTFTAGASVNTTTHAGCAVISLSATGIAWTTGSSGTVTVTGTARAADGTLHTGRTWTGTLSGTGTLTATLTPGTTGDLCVSVSAMTLPSALSAGTVQVIGGAPSGRVDTATIIPQSAD